jgi:hypothetical protein
MARQTRFAAAIQVWLHTDLIVRSLQPRAKFDVDVAGRSNRDKVGMPVTAKRLVFDDAATADRLAQSETRHEVIFSRCQAREAHSRHAHQTGFLRQNLNVAQRPK